MDELRLLENAPRIAEEAVALHSADQCPEGEFDLILDSSQLGLQIHESIGHPIELDRVLGSEANYAGMSFLTLDKLRHLRYGSDIVNVVCDARLEHGPGLGTFAFDDEGVPAQGTDIIRDGQFVGYMTSRETAAAVGETRSNGTMRADGWAPHPADPHDQRQPAARASRSLDEVFDVDHGIYMETNRSWSIDDKRYNFQFGCEIAWEIRDGKRVRMLKNPSYSGISTEFWNACAAIAGREHWTLWGMPNCGKGQPEQVMGTGHGASPARFRKIKVGERLCGLSASASSQQVLGRRARAGRHRGRGHRLRRRRRRSRASPTTPFTRTWPSASTQLSVRAGDRRPHRARHHQPPRPRRHPRAWWRRRSRSPACTEPDPDLPPLAEPAAWSRGGPRYFEAHRRRPRPRIARAPWRRPSAWSNRPGQTAAGIYSTDASRFFAVQLARRVR